jgi:cell division GTPase FtsZ
MERKVFIMPGVFAVNTDATDLSGLSVIKPDYQHRILIGGRRTGGHGVGKVNELGAEIAREDADKIIDALRSTKNFYESDAFLIIAGAAGGTGSGSVAVVSNIIKERYPDKPAYALLVLPFEHEERTEERTVYNAAVCLKSTYSVADAVFLVDNQRYIKKDASLRLNLSKINKLIVEPFYDLLCAGEEKEAKYVGSKTLDAGDIIQSLSGWTAIGCGYASIKKRGFLFSRSNDFRDRDREVHSGLKAVDEALSELSMECDPRDAGRALFLTAAPAKEMSTGLIKEIGDWVRNLAPNAVIRNGDYPRKGGNLSVSLIFSELSDVGRIREYYRSTANMATVLKQRGQEARDKLREIEDLGRDIPSLL